MPNTYTEAPAPSDYAAKAQRLVPGRSDLQTMAAILIAERAPEQATVLVVGAGGGVELSAFAGMYPQWRFVGVDPSQPMLALAETVLGASITRVELLHGYVDAAPAGPFDAATCILTMHFMTVDERRSALQEIRHRLKPGAPFVLAHPSFSQARENANYGCRATPLLPSHRGWMPKQPAARRPRSAQGCPCSVPTTRKPCLPKQDSLERGCSTPAWRFAAG